MVKRWVEGGFNVDRPFKERALEVVTMCPLCKNFETVDIYTGDTGKISRRYVLIRNRIYHDCDPRIRDTRFIPSKSQSCTLFPVLRKIENIPDSPNRDRSGVAMTIRG